MIRLLARSPTQPWRLAPADVLSYLVNPLDQASPSGAKQQRPYLTRIRGCTLKPALVTTKAGEIYQQLLQPGALALKRLLDVLQDTTGDRLSHAVAVVWVSQPARIIPAGDKASF